MKKVFSVEKYKNFKKSRNESVDDMGWADECDGLTVKEICEKGYAVLDEWMVEVEGEEEPFSILEYKQKLFEINEEEKILKEFEKNYVYDLYEDKIILCHKTSSQKIVINKNWKLMMSTYYKNNPAPLSFNDIKNIFKFLEVKGWFIDNE